MSSTNDQDAAPESQNESVKRKDTSSKRRDIPIRRRDVLILGTVWLLGCGIVAGLLGLFYFNANPVVPEPPGSVATYTIPFTEDSAKTMYLLAQQEAQNWQSDVDLVASSTRWSNASLDDLGQAGIWDFRFFSDKSDRIFFTFVTPEKEVISRANINKLRKPPYLINPADWVLDSNEAISIWVNNGGGAFLEAFPENQVEVLLRQTEPRPVWDIVGISADQSQVVYLSIDAADGTVLNR
ncbi:MAG: PepSY domain-containing protein [Chloroflexi bacterium]|nr:PepSY domain-containing protein [Chloroflexota bacterium]